MTLFDVQNPGWGLVATILGGGLGWLLAVAVRPLMASVAEEMESVSSGGRPLGNAPSRGAMLVGMAVAAGLWWWEIGCLAQLPGGAVPVALGGLVPRYGAHLMLAWLMAAAAWIDIRHRVIPDAITVPGVLAGLGWLWLFPASLLPIAREAPRSFAAPLLEPDVLGFRGALEVVPQTLLLGPAPLGLGLILPLSIFGVWWWACTSPLETADRRRGWDGRTLVLLGGVVGIAAAWGWGTERFAGLLSGLLGVAVSGGLVWATRAGASRALGREAMGMGDVTLMAMVGAWLGWQACVVAFFLAAFIGLAHGLFQLAVHREAELPYGPSLCLAAAGVVVAWRPLWAWVGPACEDPGLLAGVLGMVVVLTALTLLVWRMLRDRTARV